MLHIRKQVHLRDRDRERVCSRVMDRETSVSYKLVDECILRIGRRVCSDGWQTPVHLN